MLSSQLDMSHIETETAICKISIMMLWDHGHPYIQSTGDNVYSGIQFIAMILFYRLKFQTSILH